MHSFVANQEFIPADAESLIIGTFPSVIIRRDYNQLHPDDTYFYYGSHNNYFWDILSELTNIPVSCGNDSEAVEERKKILNRLKLGITDIVYECRTEKYGAADSNLEIIKLNDGIVELLKKYRNIRTIYFTSSAGSVNADSLTMRLLYGRNIIKDVKIIKKKSPKIRSFIFNDDYKITAIALYSPSPNAARGGVTEDKRMNQYRKYLCRSFI